MIYTFRNVLDHKIVGFPVMIESDKYARNAYYFNLCFVCEANRRTVQYEPIVRKLSEYLILMENENNFLSNEEHKSRLQNLLSRVMTDLNESGVTIMVDNISQTTIFLKLVNVPNDPPPVSFPWVC